MAVPRQRPSVRPASLLVDGVPFETVETVKRPSSCPAGSTTAGASSSSPVRLSSARQADLGQNEHTPGVEASSVYCRDCKYVAVKPVEPLSSVLSIPSSDRLPRPSIDCGAALGLRNERPPGFPALDERPPSFNHPSALSLMTTTWARFFVDIYPGTRIWMTMTTRWDISTLA